MRDETFGVRNYETLGMLVSLTTSFHNLIVIALAKKLNVSLCESRIVFAPRSSGDLTSTIKALMKRRNKTDKNIKIDEILSKMAAINKIISRTNHVHGVVTMHATPVDKEDHEMGVSFIRNDISGGTFKSIIKRYETSDEFRNVVDQAQNNLKILQKLLDVSIDEIADYLNLAYD